MMSLSLARAVQPLAPDALSVDKESGPLAAMSPSLLILEECKCAAARLDVRWPVAVAKAPRSCYEGKTRGSSKKPLSMFLELLVELARLWADCSYSGRSPSASTLDC